MNTPVVFYDAVISDLAKDASLAGVVDFLRMATDGHVLIKVDQMGLSEPALIRIGLLSDEFVFGSQSALLRDIVELKVGKTTENFQHQRAKAINPKVRLPALCFLLSLLLLTCSLN
jgi:hypothetical protein